MDQYEKAMRAVAPILHPLLEVVVDDVYDHIKGDTGHYNQLERIVFATIATFIDNATDEETMNTLRATVNDLNERLNISLAAERILHEEVKKYKKALRNTEDALSEANRLP